MGIAKKGTRKIRVNGNNYRWVVSPDDEPGIGLVIEHYECPKQRFILYFPHGTVITPILVKRSVFYGLKCGWDPEERGAALRLFWTDDKQFELSLD